MVCCGRGDGDVTGLDGLDFADLLRLLRGEAGLTQDELAQAAGVSQRAVSDLERRVNVTARKATAELLAGVLGLDGPARERFVQAARGRIPASAVLAVRPEPLTSAAGESAPLDVRYSLPPDMATFTGRDPELDRIATAMSGAGAGGVVAIHAIDGMPGVGKTTLAVHAAHLLRDRFPDRQLFVDLHAHTPGQEPVPPAAALAGLLAALGVEARALPADLEGRAGLWRDRMAGQRAVLVLDNAASSAQVAPLLPGGQDCLVLVTSRRHLGDLAGPVVSVPVEVLPPGEAQEMFVRLAPGTAPGSDVARLVRLAGYLPLAISLLARLYARHPSWTLADLTAETKASMLTLAAEHDSVAAAFELSYRYLPPSQQRFLHFLGLHLGPTIEAYAGAALAGVSVAESAGYLDDLHREGLLTETSYRRYGMHDLIRHYALDRAATDPGRPQAVERLLDYYTHAAALAESRLARQSATPAPALRMPSAEMPSLPGSNQALAWARAERASMFACLEHVINTGQHARVVALTASLAALLRQDGPWAEAIARHDTAVQAARRLGDRLGQANALSNLGIVRRLTGDYPGAARAQEAALALYHELGDRLGQANALNELGAAQRATGNYPGAAHAHEAALGIFRDIGDRLGQANALSYLGILQYLTDDYPGAAQASEAALRLYSDLDDRLGQAHALSNLGFVRRLTGDYESATQADETALGIFRDLGDRLGQAHALNDLGQIHQAVGNYAGAAQAAREALDLYRSLGNRLGQANALKNLATAWRLSGDYPAAADAIEQALGLYRSLGDRGGEAMAINEAGTLHRTQGDLGQATHCHQQALDLARRIGSAWDEAHALAGLARCALATGQRTDAQTWLQEAYKIFQRIGAVEAANVAAELSTLVKRQPAL